MAFYDEMAATALELLAEFGQAVSIERVTGRSLDPVTGAVTAGTTTTLTTTGVVLVMLSENAMVGVDVLAGDRRLVISNEVAPALGDRVIIGSDRWKIITIDAKNPAGTPIVYFLHIRK